MNTRALTNGRDRSKGWAQDEAGNWLASAHDRRRMATSVVKDLAEKQGGVTGPQILEVVGLMKVGEDDPELLKLVGSWLTTP